MKARSTFPHILITTYVPFCWCCPILAECAEELAIGPAELQRANCAPEVGRRS